MSYKKNKHNHVKKAYNIQKATRKRIKSNPSRLSVQKIISLQNNYIKTSMTPTGYDRILDEKLVQYNYYKALNVNEIKDIKNNYLKFYNAKLEKSTEKYNLIKEKKYIKKELKKEIFNKKQDIIIELNSKLSNVSGNKLDVFDKGFYTWGKYYNLLNQANVMTYTYYYENGIKKYKYLC